MYIRDLIEQKYGTAAALPGRPEDLHHAGLSTSRRKMEEVAQSNAANLRPARRQQHRHRGDEPEDRRDPGDGRQHGLLNADIDGQVNVALSERQPGSSIKPLVYLTAFSKGWLAGDR